MHNYNRVFTSGLELHGFAHKIDFLYIYSAIKEVTNGGRFRDFETQIPALFLVNHSNNQPADV